MTNTRHNKGQPKASQGKLLPGQNMCFICAGNALVAAMQEQPEVLNVEIAVTWGPYFIAPPAPMAVSVPLCMMHLPVGRKGSGLLEAKAGLQIG